ncbi:hypothetical protein QVD17_14924 [Tagetes erecta]|uniref:Protein kinase domain-containing protein n=1 Tax=Tagetes erecta TaxID=13708 RepID=A0AAD8KND3_TARER|nr:hypothetical protein QVD17_14924 [Tagetes erecta]
MHLAPLAKSHYEKKTLQDIIHPRLWNKISYHQSLVKYSEIAYSCLNDERACRPDADYIVDELEKALEFLLTSENTDDTLQPLGIDQVVNKFEKSLELKSTDKNTSKNLKKNHKKNHRMSLGDITQATQNFHKDNCIGGGGFGRVYKGKLQDGVGFKTIVAKRLDPSLGQGEQQFLCELQILLQYKHENVIGLVGYCAEKDEKIIVYEYASKGSLDRYLNDACLTWVERLNICIDVASALDFLHGGAEKQAKVIHRDIKSANILLDNDWKARLADFGLSLISPLVQDTDYVIDHWCGTPGYSDPFYKKSRFLTIESDIYSFGVVLFEILCGRSTSTIKKHEALYLPEFVKNRFEEGTHNEVVFEQIRKRIMPKSLTTFQEIAYQCLEHEREKRPTTKQVLMKLKNALELQNMASTLAKFDDLRIPLKDVEKATNNFHHDKITLHGIEVMIVRLYMGH